jgi:hypothetical protein
VATIAETSVPAFGPVVACGGQIAGIDPQLTVASVSFPGIQFDLREFVLLGSIGGESRLDFTEEGLSMIDASAAPRDAKSVRE